MTIDAGPDALASALLTPSGDELFVRLAYVVVLGRLPEADSVDAAVDALARGMTRQALLRGLVASTEFEEAAVIAAAASGGAGHSGVGMSERVVEVPWALGRYQGERSVLDIGYANAPRPYLAALLRIGIPWLCGVDLAVGVLPGAGRAQADARRLPFRDGAFELALCVSTLEHIGYDNRVYGLEAEAAPGDVAALCEMARVLRPGGRLLVTVPYGAAEDHGWFHQYSKEEWSRLVASTPFRPGAATAFRTTPSGWIEEGDDDVLAACRYADGAPAATAVLCAELIR